MKSLPPKTDRVKTFLDEFLIKLATMQREDSREERAILETVSIISFLSSREVENIMKSVSEDNF